MPKWSILICASFLRRLKRLRSELSDAYKRLDAKWDEITECLKALPISCSVSYTFSTGDYGPDFDCLVWRKWNGTKRICIESHSFCPNNPYSDFEVKITPFDEWSGEQRICMLEHVPGLFEAAAKATEQFIEKTKK